MLTDLYVDNFRCLVNFRIQPKPFQLWLGENGSGKTSVLEVLRAIQRVILGDHVSDIFETDDLTLWMSKPQQEFRFVFQQGDDTFAYHLTIEHNRNKGTCWIALEELSCNEQPLYRFEGNQAKIFKVTSNTGEVTEETSVGNQRSFLSSIARADDDPITKFRNYLRNLLIIHPIPTLMEEISQKEQRDLYFHADNFASWYRHVVQESSQVAINASIALREVLTGFDSLSLRELGNARRLTATFRIAGQDRDIPFSKLSDGQRQLIVLYVLLHALEKTHSTLIIDEPDNFIALREIQPWLTRAEEVCEEAGRQCIIISHHPEVINPMARGNEIWFSRPKGEHVVTDPYPTTPGLTPAETMVRGWDNE